MQPIAMETPVIFDHRVGAGKGNKENIEEVNDNLVFKKDWKKSCPKIALNGRESLIENFFKNLGTNLKSFETCVLF